MPGSNGINLTRGTVSSPTYSFEGDGDTGVNSSTANEVQIVCGGVSQLTANASGLQLKRRVELVPGDTTVTAADTNTLFVDQQSSGTTTFILPATAEGLVYTFYCGNAGSEINISPVAADKIFFKGITAADNKDLINTGGTNVVGDQVTLVGDGVDGWYAYGTGTWAREA